MILPIINMLPEVAIGQQLWQWSLSLSLSLSFLMWVIIKGSNQNCSHTSEKRPTHGHTRALKMRVYYHYAYKNLYQQQQLQGTAEDRLLQLLLSKLSVEKMLI